MTDNIMGAPLPEGIGDDVRLVIQTPHGPLLDIPLVQAAYIVRSLGQILPFVYRPPLDPDNPDAPRPLRRAVLTIVDDEPIEREPLTPITPIPAGECTGPHRCRPTDLRGVQHCRESCTRCSGARVRPCLNPLTEGGSTRTWP